MPSLLKPDKSRTDRSKAGGGLWDNNTWDALGYCLVGVGHHIIRVRHDDYRGGADGCEGCAGVLGAGIA